jgi:hypothetical protein
LFVILFLFISYITDPLAVLDALLQPLASNLPAHIQGIYIQATLKIFALSVAAGTPTKKSLNLLGEDEELDVPAPPTLSKESAKTGNSCS